ncbi:hypothetical protein ACLBR5_23855 [Escherichia coli]
MASRLGSVWHAVYVETPALHRLPEKNVGHQRLTSGAGAGRGDGYTF